MFRQNIDRKVVIRSTCRKLSLTMMYWKKRWEPEKEGVFCSKFWLFFYILWIHLQFFSLENFMDRMPIIYSIWYFMYICITHIYIYIESFKSDVFTQPPATFFLPQHFLGRCFGRWRSASSSSFWLSPGRFLKSPRSKMARPMDVSWFFSQVWMVLRYAEKPHKPWSIQQLAAGLSLHRWHAVDASITTLHMIVWLVFSFTGHSLAIVGSSF